MGKKKVKTIEANQEGLKEGGVIIPVPKKKKTAHKVNQAILHICATYNNTIVSLTDQKGNVIAQSSGGRLGFKGAKKATPFAAMKIIQHISMQARPYNVQEIEVRVKGLGSGREAAIRALGAQGFNVSSIRDVTPIPHNGCRPRKKRRV